MKMLLTSGGITNQSIAKALFDLVGKKPEEITLVFIPTAANVEKGDKGWFIDDLINLKKQNFKSIHIADISAVSEDIWRPQFEEADVMFFEGGYTSYLMEWVEKSGLKKLLPEFLETKVYVSLSAGSVITNKNLQLKISQEVYEEDLDKTEEIPGLNYVDFFFLPHLNSPFFPKLKKETLQEIVMGMPEKMYVMDDQSALKVVDGKMEIVTEGEYFEFN